MQRFEIARWARNKVSDKTALVLLLLGFENSKLRAILSLLCGPYLPRCKPSKGPRGSDKTALVLLLLGFENSKTRAILSLLCGPLFASLQAQQGPARE